MKQHLLLQRSCWIHQRLKKNKLKKTPQPKKPQTNKKIHKTNDGVSHCDCWLIILEMIKHSGLLFRIHQKASLDWRTPFLLGCNCSCPFLAYLLWFLIVEIYPVAGLSLEQKVHLSVWKLWFMLSVFMRATPTCTATKCCKNELLWGSGLTIYFYTASNDLG